MDSEKRGVRVKDLLSNSAFIVGSVWNEQKKLMCVVAILVVFSSIASPLTSGILGLIVNALSAPVKNVSEIFLLVITLVVVLSFIYTVQMIRGDRMQILRQYVKKKFEMLVATKKSELDVSTHESPDLNDLLQKVSDAGISRTQDFFQRNYDILWDFVGVCAAMAIVASFNAWILLLIVAFTLPSLWIEMYAGNRIWKMYSNRIPKWRKYSEVRRHFNYIGGLMETIVFQTSRHLLGLLDKSLDDFFTEESQEYRLRTKLRIRAMIFSYLALGLSLAFFVNEVILGHIRIGSLVFIYSALQGFKSSLTDLFMSFGRQYEDSLFVSDMRKFFALEPKIQKTNNGIVLAEDEIIGIEFRNVSFRYADHLPLVLSNVSFSVGPGEIAAFVGKSGSGKSTIIKLMLRMYNPTSGEILVNGHDIRDINIDSFYKACGFLSQDYPRYRFVAQDNVAMGNVAIPITDENLERAAKLSGADQFINQWPERFKKILGKEFVGGVDLSGGEWQRVALARVHYRNPRFIVLDEPTSSVDVETEAEIFENLMKQNHSTKILVSHRFGTIKNSDRIFVVKDGKISESGNHDELMQQEGIYAHLYTLQATPFNS
ncbi:MAG: xenobiotic-transporting ATPase [Parcubacteria group bacterium LiPW_41]|nr:MAG: xenobiotic-transporting ATPase [Parcubacteria group bacterium LiPW_41]